jgi:hypothetical protein
MVALVRSSEKERERLERRKKREKMREEGKGGRRLEKKRKKETGRVNPTRFFKPYPVLLLDRVSPTRVHLSSPIPFK